MIRVIEYDVKHSDGRGTVLETYEQTYVEAVCDDAKPYTYAEALAICKEETGKVFEGAKAEEKYISKIETDVFKKKDIDETYEGTILLEEDAGAEKILDEVENYFIEAVPTDGCFEKIIFVFFIKKH